MGVNNPGLNIFSNIPPLPSKGTGRVYFVGNATTFVPGGVGGVDDVGAGGDTPQRPFATIDYAVGQCTAGRGDVIYVLPGHVEAVAAAAGLELDVAGITILFLGDGATRGTIRFGTAVGADMNVTSANITLGAKGQDLGPRFLANIDALTGPIDVNAARFRMYGAKWNDGTTINTTDCVVADANADNMEIEDFEFVDAGAAGTQKQSFIQVAAATGVILRKIKCTGDFGTGIIENGTAWIDALLEDLVLDNASTSPTVALLLQATSSGWVRNSSLRVASGLVGYTADNDMQFDNVGVIGTDAQGAGSTVIGSAADAAATGAVTATDTIMAYLKQLVTQTGIELDTNTLGAILYGTAGIATFPAAAIPADAVSLAEVIRQLYAALEGTAASQNGVATWPTAAAYANNVSIAEVLGYVQDGVRRGTGTTLPANTSLADYAEATVSTAAAVIAAGTATIFTVAGGPIAVMEMISVCVTANDGTATLLKYTADPTDGAATDLTIASGSLASLAAGNTALVTGTFASAPTVTTNGTVAAGTATKFIVPVGVIQTITTGGATTGTWTHHLRYKPLSRGVTVS